MFVQADEFVASEMGQSINDRSPILPFVFCIERFPQQFDRFEIWTPAFFAIVVASAVWAKNHLNPLILPELLVFKKTETELEQRVKQFRSLSENIPGIIYEYEFKADGTEGITYISPAIERIFGIKPSGFQNYLSYVHPDDRERIIQKNEHSRDTLEPFYDESRLVVPGKSLKWHAVHSSFSYLSQTGAKVFTGFMMDITERKNIEQTLQANEEKYRNIIENMNLGLLEVDNDENITYANQRFCSMSGYSMNELLGQTARKFLSVVEGANLLEDKLSCPEIGLHNSKQKWRDIQKCLAVNGKASTAKSLSVRFVGNI